MFRNLPSNILMKIFEYDSTYHDIYKKVHEKEFFNCSRTWRIISKRSKDKESRGWYYRQYTPYNMTYSAAKKLAEYWNYKYRYDENLNVFKMGKRKCTGKTMTTLNILKHGLI